MSNIKYQISHAAERGVPSLVWRAGQARRLEMIHAWSKTKGATILVDGCGMGQYAIHLLDDSPHVVAFDVEHERTTQAHQHVPMAHVAAAEALPYPANSFDMILSHEVLEHVQDDRAALGEMTRVLKPGGRVILFCPNRWYPVETHGHYWRGEYHFGNTPLINYLPDVWRDKLAPHVRVYTWHGLRRLLDGLPVRIVHHTRIYGGYDNIIARFGPLGRLLRAALYVLEHTPLRIFGLSHFVVIEKAFDI
jgi:SAM-dependent methyltransferase